MWRARHFGGVVRLIHYLDGAELPHWHLFYADDGNLFAGSQNAPIAFLFPFLVMVVVGVPISWKEVRGGLSYEFIGYSADVSSFQFGLSDQCAK